MADHDDFDREMHDADWTEIYERQAESADLVARMCDLLGLEAGDHVLEIGSGPGYISARLAEWVAPGTVYALDRQHAALRYLLDEAPESTAHVRLLVGDAATLPVCFSQPTPALASRILHHVPAPAHAVEEVAAAIPRTSPFLVVEYYPGADEGPPEDHRIAPGRMREWLARAGFALEAESDLSESTYAMLARR